MLETQDKDLGYIISSSHSEVLGGHKYLGETIQPSAVTRACEFFLYNISHISSHPIFFLIASILAQSLRFDAKIKMPPLDMLTLRCH